MTKSQVFQDAVQIIDSEFGEGYAMRNPQLLRTLVESMTKERSADVADRLIEIALSKLTGSANVLG